MNEADLADPIVVEPDGGGRDGMHRIARALVGGGTAIAAHRLPTKPERDFRECAPDDLSY